jgi:hypothetical protein
MPISKVSYPKYTIQLFQGFNMQMREKSIDYKAGSFFIEE